MNFERSSIVSTFVCWFLLSNYCDFGSTKVVYDSDGFQLLLNNGASSNEIMDSLKSSILQENVLKRWTRSADEDLGPGEGFDIEKILNGLRKEGEKGAIITEIIEDDATIVYDETSTIIPTGGTIDTSIKEVVKDDREILLDSVCEGIRIPSNCSNVTTTTSGNDNENSMCQILNTMKLLCKLLKQGKLEESTKSYKNEDDILMRYLPQGYNRFEVPITNLTLHLPNGTKLNIVEPAESYVFLNIREVRDLDELNEQMTLDMDLVVIWIDGAILKNINLMKSTLKSLRADLTKHVFLDPSVLEKIWSPDLYFEEMVSMTKPTLMGKSETIVLFPALGLFIYRTRALVKLFCPMEFYHYPADTQECVFTLKSFSYKTSLLKVAWKIDNEGTGVYLNEISDSNFDFQVASHSEEESIQRFGPLAPNASEGNYSKLIFTLRARRKMSYHILQTYTPSMFFVIVTRMCFLIPVEMFEARVGIAMSTLLTTTSMFSSVRESTPIVSYVKAIDTWMAMCINFIFMALVAFIASAWVHRMLCKLQEEEGSMPKRRRSIYGIREKPEESKKRYLRMARFIDRYPPVIISIGFVTFNIVYWSWLIVDSQHFNWSVNSSYNNVGN